MVEAQGQITCSGTFGDNIFEDGDFGSGAENIFPTDPKIAPGYIYTHHTPPNDGYYTLTNDMSKWISNHTTWISITDRSNDPQGYMMVVNASEEPGVFYEQTIHDLCPNTIYEFSVDIINIVRRGVPDHILPELEFLIDGEVKHSTGRIPQDETWHKHGFTFSIEPGQTSVTLTLINNAPGGVGNDLALDNITFRPCGAEDGMIDEEILYFCKDDPDARSIPAPAETKEYFIQWQTSLSPEDDWKDTGSINLAELQQDLTRAGTFYYRLMIARTEENLSNPNCRTFSEVITAEVLPVEYETWDTLCQGEEKKFGQMKITEAGDYTENFTSSKGCDSIVTLHLEVVKKIPIEYEFYAADPLCHDSEDGSIQIDAVVGGYPPYRYVVDQDTSFSEAFEHLSAGEKKISILDRFDCRENKSHTLVNPELFLLDSIPDQKIILGETIDLHLKANQTIADLFSKPDLFQDCLNCNSISFLPAQSGEIIIRAENLNGCHSSQSFYIEVDTENLPIAFPNAFSPNRDGINETFDMITPGRLVRKIISVEILDRWGNQIHHISETTGEYTHKLWDGTAQGTPADPGVYAFHCHLELINGERKRFSGEIHLLR